MGTFFGSISLWGADPAKVVTACETLYAEQKVEFFIAPEREGWVTVYPSEHGQDVRVAASLAKAVGCPALHLGVHDEWILFWAYYDRDGTEIDLFVSNEELPLSPDGDPGDWPGRPEVFLERVGAEGVAKIQALLREPRELDLFWATNSLRVIGGCLGLTHLTTSFEDALVRRSEVPSRSVRVPAQRTLRSILAELKAQGILKASFKAPEKRARATVRRMADGSLGLVWEKRTYGAGLRIDRWAPPWRSPQSSVEVPCTTHHVLDLSASGQRVAVASSRPNKSVYTSIIDLSDPGTAFEVPKAWYGAFLEDGQSFLIVEDPGTPRPPGPVPPGATDGPRIKRFSSTGILEVDLAVPVYHSRAALDPRGRVALGSEEIFIQDLEAGWRNWIPLPELGVNMMATLVGVLTGRREPVLQRERVGALFFDRPRNRLIVGTDAALRAFDWDDSKVIPPAPPVFEHALTALQPRGQVHPLCVDESDGALLCGGEDDELIRVDLNRGTVEALMHLPEHRFVDALVLDHDTLVTVATKSRGADGHRVDVWSYQVLRGR